jgi:hypothetical protein
MRALLLVVLLVSVPALAHKKKSTPPPKETPPPAATVKETPKKEEPKPELVPPPAPISDAKRDDAPVASVALDHSQDAPPTNVASPERIGVSLDLWGEGSRMSGDQCINNFCSDESFDYGAGPISASLYVLFQPWQRVRIGPQIRFLGNYGDNSGNGLTFGYQFEGSAVGEWSYRTFEKFDVVLGGRAGMSVLVPGEEFAAEIRRLQAQGAAVWSLPRLGWVAGLNAGLRRQIAGRLYGHLDLNGQVGHQWLFATDQIVEGLRFRKNWGNDIRRLGVSLAVEVAL